ncbi:PREDICTED: uncharacterized protein LOC105562307 [Vollenhovia emeryi]|uniref:uncharacterized protein LOC105562307 n=1 Tax=Vollenhovia emeryi TaxID=411798 RepID=UPI0005F52477|nr:PREDICTED: uncharacterized protein LOC105562307 [Vollenhovia emeryi]
MYILNFIIINQFLILCSTWIYTHQLSAFGMVLSVLSQYILWYHIPNMPKISTVCVYVLYKMLIYCHIEGCNSTTYKKEKNKNKFYFFGDRLFRQISLLSG